MRLLLIFIAALHCYADESVVLTSAVGSSLVRTFIEEQVQNQAASTEEAVVTPAFNMVPLTALQSLTPAKSPFVVDYGQGILSKKLEAMTLVLLEYPMISSVVGALSDEVVTSSKDSKFNFTFNMNRRELRLSYSF